MKITSITVDKKKAAKFKAKNAINFPIERT